MPFPAHPLRGLCPQPQRALSPAPTLRGLCPQPPPSEGFAPSPHPQRALPPAPTPRGLCLPHCCRSKAAPPTSVPQPELSGQGKKPGQRLATALTAPTPPPPSPASPPLLSHLTPQGPCAQPIMCRMSYSAPNVVSSQAERSLARLATEKERRQ